MINCASACHFFPLSEDLSQFNQVILTLLILLVFVYSVDAIGILTAKKLKQKENVIEMG